MMRDMGLSPFVADLEAHASAASRWCCCYLSKAFTGLSQVLAAGRPQQQVSLREGGTGQVA